MNKEIFKIFKQNNISFKKFGFSKKLYSFLLIKILDYQINNYIMRR